MRPSSSCARNAARASAESSCGWSAHERGYRLGDAIRFMGPGVAAETVGNWPGSIGAQYILRSPPALHAEARRLYRAHSHGKASRLADTLPINTSLLWQIVDERAAAAGPAWSAALHLRVGDVIDVSNASLLDFLCVGVEQSGPHARSAMASSEVFSYAPPLRFFRATAQQLRALRVTSVHLVANAYENGNNSVWRESGGFNRSCGYVHAVGRLLAEEGLRVELELGGRADDDFAAMSRASVFAPTGGGFSALVAAMVRARGGRVLRATADWCHDRYVPLSLQQRHPAVCAGSGSTWRSTIVPV